jgi:FkbM family methyltransferase
MLFLQKMSKPFNGTIHMHQPDDFFYNKELGQIAVIGGRPSLLTISGQSGCAVFGPYSLVQPGRHVATFNVKIHNPAPLYQDFVCGYAEVVADGGNKILNRVKLYASRILNGLYQTYVGFYLDKPTIIETRVNITGRAELSIDLDRPIINLRAEDPRDLTPVVPPLTIVTDPFYLDNAGHFGGMYDNGASITPDDKGTLVTISDITFRMRSIEDFQIVNEVFFYNEYNFSLQRDCLVIDIGMNIGLVSLRMANLPYVKEVHSFEPFSRPFQRAAENFCLNPIISQKIRPHPFGLSDREETLTVKVSVSEETIGTSVRGLDCGQDETIKIRDAAAVLLPIFASAKERGLAIVIKMDCEGSEFPIFDSLERSGLLQDINALLVEWHKTWSPSLTQKDLFERLLPKGFLIFDKTQASDVGAGQFYAVKAG